METEIESTIKYLQTKYNLIIYPSRFETNSYYAQKCQDLTNHFTYTVSNDKIRKTQKIIRIIQAETLLFETKWNIFSNEDKENFSQTIIKYYGV